MLGQWQSPLSAEDEWGSSQASQEEGTAAAARPKTARPLRVAAFWAASGLALVGCGLAVASLASAALQPRHATSAVSTRGVVSLATGELEVTLPEDPAKDCKLKEGWASWVSVFDCPKVEIPCSMEGDDCTRSECCLEPGKICYKKTDYYASCKKTCTEGINPKDKDGEPWSCETRGVRAKGTPGILTNGTKLNADGTIGPTTGSLPADSDAADAADAAGAAVKTSAASGPCVEANMDCTSSQCCVGAGLKCYAKNEYYAMCKATCEVGAVDPGEPGKPWACTVLGDSDGADAAADDAADEDAVAAGGASCVAPGTDCSKAGCCKDASQSCYRKNAGWASCKPTGSCQAGKPDPSDVDTDPWDCTEMTK